MTLAPRAAPVPPADDPFLGTPSDPFAIPSDLDLARAPPAPRRPSSSPMLGLDDADAPVPGVERGLAADVARSPTAASRYDGMDVSALALDVAPGAAPAPSSGRGSRAVTPAPPLPRVERFGGASPAGPPAFDPVEPPAGGSSERSASSPTPPATPVRPARGPARRPDPTVIAPPLPPARAGAWRSAAMNALSLAALLGLAVALFIAGRGGAAHVGPAAATALSVSGVTGGLYDTVGGAPVLVVRGRLTARAAVAGPVRVDVQLVDRDAVVAAATGVAGGAATPEEVHAVATAADVEKLRDLLQLRAAARLAPGESAPFVVVFPPPAPDPLRVEVRVVPRAD